MATSKNIHTLVVDTGAIIKNDPAASTLLGQADNLVTVPAVISEIRDAATRSRFETTLKPFMTIQTPAPASVKFVTDFARRTGDLAVLSRPDLEIIALTYQLDCEQNGGDWRLRRTPGQKSLNGKPPDVEQAEAEGEVAPGIEHGNSEPAAPDVEDTASQHETESNGNVSQHVAGSVDDSIVESVASNLDKTHLDAVEQGTTETKLSIDPQSTQEPINSQDEDSEPDSDGWITPANLKKTKAAEVSSTSEKADHDPMKVAVITSDYAMQNVILQINLNLIASSMARIKQVKNHVLRCHACFQVCKDMTKQFCPRCGQPVLTRVSCSTNAKGEFKIYLKKNFQHNTRGDRYSIPKPTHGASNGRLKGGGKNGWGHDLILAEDQKEYQAATTQQRRQREKNLMDPDYLPSILTGDRVKTGRPQVGAGRNVNSRKR